MEFPQLDFATYPSQIFWLLVCVCVLFSFVKLVFVPRLAYILDTREKRIQGDKDKAQDVILSTQKIQKEYEDQLQENRHRARQQREAQMKEFNERRQERFEKLQRSFERKRAALEKGDVRPTLESPNFIDVLLRERGR